MKRHIYSVDIEERVTRITTIKTVSTSAEAAGIQAVEAAKLGIVPWGKAKEHREFAVLITEKGREVDDGIPE